MVVSVILCNVGRSGGNQSLLFCLFCRVSLFFVLEVPVGGGGIVLAHEECDVELLSFVVGSGVAVYAWGCDVGLFDMVRHNVYACVVRMMGPGVGYFDVAGVYVGPQVSGAGMRDIMGNVGKVDVMAGDLNARHTDCSAGVGDDVFYPSGISLRIIIAVEGLVCLPICGPTYRDVSVLDLTLCLAGSVLSHGYLDLAGLDHPAHLLRFACGTPPGIVSGRIS